jgi:hypothetical protein
MTITSSPAYGWATLTLRYGVVLLSGLGVLSHFLTPAQVKFVESSDFITAASAVFGALAVAWAYIETFIQKAELVAAAKTEPKDVTIK